MHKPTSMAEEIAAAPAVVAQQAADLAGPIGELVTRLRARPPRVVVTCGRGSSAHAATFAKHLFERYLGIPVAAAAPSIASIYGQQLSLEGQLCLVVSQSGESDDLIAVAESAKASGALTVAVVNTLGSPLTAACDVVLPIGAGPELSVAATKTFVATAGGLAEADRGVDRRSGCTRRPWRGCPIGWRPRQRWTGVPRWQRSRATDSLVTIGRGPTLAIAREAALKLQETCNLHAEPFSSAEFRHGPLALASPRRPVLVLRPTDACAPGVDKLAADLRKLETPTLVAGPDATLPVLRARACRKPMPSA